MSTDHLRLDSLVDLVGLLRNEDKLMMAASWPNATVRTGRLYCPSCGQDRRMEVATIFASCSLGSKENQREVVLGGHKLGAVSKNLNPNALPPAVFKFTCVECLMLFTALVYRGPSGPAIAVFPSCHGGLSTPRTPPGVAYYLDQANRAKSAGAYSATMVMFRSALEHLLFQQGFKNGTCGTKLTELETSIKEGKAPEWTRDFDTEMLTALKQIANASAHPNDGDITRQEHLDTSAIAHVQAAFSMLLQCVYEEPHRRATMKADLKATQTAMTQ